MSQSESLLPLKRSPSSEQIYDSDDDLEADDFLDDYDEDSMLQSKSGRPRSKSKFSKDSMSPFSGKGLIALVTGLILLLILAVISYRVASTPDYVAESVNDNSYEDPSLSMTSSSSAKISTPSSAVENYAITGEIVLPPPFKATENRGNQQNTSLDGHSVHFWPLPQLIISGTESVYIDPLNFTFTSNLDTPFIVNMLDRYRNLLIPTSLSNRFAALPTGTKTLPSIKLVILSSDENFDTTTDETYNLSISLSQPSELNANTILGALRGLETLLQIVQARTADFASGELADPNEAKNLILEFPYTPWSIQDWPAFSWRAIKLDTSSSYFSVTDILRILNIMSINKLNVLQWRFSGAESFSLKLKNSSELVEKASLDFDKIYTAADVAKVLSHAHERGIRVIPEFPMPGQAASWGRSHPNITTCLDANPWKKYCANPPCGQLNPLKEETYTVVGSVIKEVLTMFPDSIVGLGGADITMDCYLLDEAVQEFLTHRGGAVESVVSLFIQRAHDHVNSIRKVVMVDENMVTNFALPLDPGSVVEVVEESLETVVNKGFKSVIGVDFTENPEWDDVYTFTPLASIAKRKPPIILGGVARLPPHAILSSLFPSISAFSERLWSGARDFRGQQEHLAKDAWKRLVVQRERIIKLGWNVKGVASAWCVRGVLDGSLKDDLVCWEDQKAGKIEEVEDGFIQNEMYEDESTEVESNNEMENEDENTVEESEEEEEFVSDSDEAEKPKEEAEEEEMTGNDSSETENPEEEIDENDDLDEGEKPKEDIEEDDDWVKVEEPMQSDDKNTNETESEAPGDDTELEPLDGSGIENWLDSLDSIYPTSGDAMIGQVAPELSPATAEKEQAIEAENAARLEEEEEKEKESQFEASNNDSYEEDAHDEQEEEMKQEDKQIDDGKNRKGKYKSTPEA